MKQCSREPTLSEVMEEPIIRAVMDRDEVTAHDLCRLMDDVRRTMGPENKHASSATECWLR